VAGTRSGRAPRTTEAWVRVRAVVERERDFGVVGPRNPLQRSGGILKKKEGKQSHKTNGIFEVFLARWMPLKGSFTDWKCIK